MGFVQIIEFQSSKIDEIRKMGEDWEAAVGSDRKARRMVVAGDRDNPGHYLNIVFFDSYEAAMENSSLPQTQELSTEDDGARRRAAEVLQPRRHRRSQLTLRSREYPPSTGAERDECGERDEADAGDDGVAAAAFAAVARKQPQRRADAIETDPIAASSSSRSRRSPISSVRRKRSSADHSAVSAATNSPRA